jgi:acetyl-CoA acetyltransferase
MRPLWEQEEDLSQMANRAAGKHLWERTDLTPDDVQMAQIYDGFSWITMSWLESLGFCGEGESGDFIDGGKNIARDGRLPLNTHGGQLSAGRLHGYGFLHEGAVQMWGQGGDRQIATPPEIGVIAAGGGNTCGCLLLVRD